MNATLHAVRIGSIGLLVAFIGCGDPPKPTAPPATEPLATVYVDDDAAPGGDGTLDAPYATLDAALRAIEALAPDEVVQPVRVVLADGAYAAPSTSWGHAAVVGTGPASTEILASEVRQRAETLSLDGVALGSLTVEASTSLALTDVHLDSGEVTLLAPTVAMDAIRGQGGVWRVEAARTDAFDVSLRESRLVFVGGVVEGADWRLVEGVGPLLSFTEAEATLSDIVVEDAGFLAGAPIDADANDRGAGIVVEGGEATLSRVEVTRSLERGVNVRGARVTGDDVLIRGAGVAGLAVQRWQTGAAPDGVAADVTLDALEVSGANVLAVVNGSSLVLREAFLENGGAAGVLASDGANLEVYDSTVLSCDNGHLSLLGDTTTGSLVGNIIRGAALESCVAVSGSQAGVRIADNTLSECAGSAIALLGVRGTEVSGNEVSGITPSPLFPDVNEGISLVGSVARISDNFVHDSDGAGIALLDSGGEVRGNRLEELGDAGIRSVGEGPDALTIVDNEVSRATVAGVLILDADARVEGNTVQQTRFSAAFGSGMGIGSAGEATVAFVGNVLRDNEQNGVFVDTTVQGEITDNVIAGNGGHGIACGGATSMRIEGNELSGNASGPVSPLCGLTP